MRIVSSYRDYYDTAMGYGVDLACVYAREPEEFDLPGSRIFSERYETGSAEAKAIADISFVKEALGGHIYWGDTYTRDKNIPRDTWKRLRVARTQALIFCGKFYPMTVVEVVEKEQDHRFLYRWSSPNVTRHILFSYEETLDLYSKYLNKKEFKDFSSSKTIQGAFKRRRRKILADIHSEFFKKSGNKHKQLTKAHHDTGVPSILVVPFKHVVYNPPLGDLGFYRVLDAFTAYQELAMFIGGVLGGKSPKMVEVDNKTKIHKAGFDEHSFRKEPGKKRRKKQ